MIRLWRTALNTLLASFAAIALSGCGGSTEITHSYVDPELKKKDLHGVMVVAVTQQQSNRIDFEDAFTKSISRHGVTAKASHTLVPGKDPSAEKLIAAAEKANLDTIMVTRYIGAKSEDVYHPGTIYYGVTPAYGAGYNRGFGGYYGRAYEVAYEQPVWTSNVTHSLISDLYAAKTKEHLWQAVSDTIKAGSDKQLRDDVIKGLISDLKKQGLLN